MKRILTWCARLGALFCVAGAYADSAAPVARIEAGMHLTPIRSIASDAAGSFLATCSDDGTVRLWSAEGGKALSVLRPPIGTARDGALYAVAVSPKGDLIACGGRTGDIAAKSHAVYLFGRDSGAIKRRIGGLPGAVNRILFSPDGLYLAVAMGGQAGVRVFRTADWALQMQDAEYGGDTFGADFDVRGRLVTASCDGHLRLYDAKFGLIAKKKLLGGKRPFSAAIRRDGSKIAVGYHNGSLVEVYSGEDLSFLFIPEVFSIDNGDLASVAWSRGGDFLYAGGTFTDMKTGFRLLRRWSEGGRGKSADMKLAKDTIMQILPLQGGRMAFCSCDPAFGIVDERNEILFGKGPVSFDFRDGQDDFRVSHLADSVRFSGGQTGGAAYRFSIVGRSLAAEQPNPKVPVLRSDGPGARIVSDWKNGRQPRFNGKPVAIQAGEFSRSASALPDGTGALVGTDWRLYRCDGEGKIRWSVQAPGAVWAVSSSGNGKCALACFGDGTIRWHRMSDGAELLAFFAHRDGRWVIWTPEGYFDSSPGGESLLGWHRDRGPDAAASFYQFAPISERFRRPDVIGEILHTLDVKRAVADANWASGRGRERLVISDLLPPN